MIGRLIVKAYVIVKVYVWHWRIKMAMYSAPEPEDYNSTYFDGPCPYMMCDGESDEHVLCKSIYEKRLAQYVESQEEYEFESLEAMKDFESKWNFWLYRHPNSMIGDMGAAPFQKFKPAVEAFLRNGF